MWLFTTLGFFSVVADTGDADRVLIRARAREDLEALRDAHLPGIEIVEGAGTDYPYRAFVPRERWVAAASALADAIDYGNFKAAVASRQGYDRADRYHAVWEEMKGLER